MLRSRVLVIVVALSPACLFPDLSALEGGGADVVGSDAPVEVGSDVDAGDAGPVVCDPTKPFSSIVPIAELDDPDSQYKATLTPDELEIWWAYTQTNDAGSVQGVYHASRTSIGTQFTNKKLESSISPGDVDPAVSDDGLSLYYVKFGSIGSWDLFETSRATRNDTFGVGFQLPSALLSTTADTAPFVAWDKSLWFLTKRSGANHVWLAQYADGGLQAPAMVASLASPMEESGVVLSHDGLWAWVASNRTDLQHAGNYDIYLVHRATLSDPFGAYGNVTEVNSAAEDRANWISWDNCRLYFESERNGSADLFVATKTP